MAEPSGRHFVVKHHPVSAGDESPGTPFDNLVVIWFVGENSGGKDPVNPLRKSVVGTGRQNQLHIFPACIVDSFLRPL